MKKNIDITAITNFAKGKYSYSDYLKVKKLFADYKTDELYDHLYPDWCDFVEKNDDSSTLDHIFEKIQYRILLEEKNDIKKRSIWSVYSKVAAILLLPVIALSILYYFSSQTVQQSPATQLAQSWVEINAPAGSRVEFSLPDGSRGWLNSGSTLKYSPVFTDQRKVALTGEAWFDVKHLENSNFTVSVKDMVINDLGTTFNVSAYNDDQFTSVILEEGKVEIDGTTGVFNEILQPNEKLSFDKNARVISVKSVDASRFSAWKDGYLVIDDETLGQVEGRIERWYNIELVIEDETIKNYRFKATFKDEPIEEVLRLLAKTTPMSYDIDNRVNDTNGHYEQKRVTIKLKK
jgi:transmembrane sensor